MEVGVYEVLKLMIWTVLMVAFSFLTQYFRAKSLFLCSPALVQPFSYLTVIMGILFDILFLGSSYDILMVLGVVMTSIGLFSKLILLKLGKSPWFWNIFHLLLPISFYQTYWLIKVQLSISNQNGVFHWDFWNFLLRTDVNFHILNFFSLNFDRKQHLLILASFLQGIGRESLDANRTEIVTQHRVVLETNAQWLGYFLELEISYRYLGVSVMANQLCLLIWYKIFCFLLSITTHT